MRSSVLMLALAAQLPAVGQTYVWPKLAYCSIAVHRAWVCPRRAVCRAMTGTFLRFDGVLA